MAKIPASTFATPKRLELREGSVEAGSLAGRTKLLQLPNVILPREIIRLYAGLPHLFTRRDVDSQLGDKICRDMKWRYLKRMEAMGLINHVSRKQYEKNYQTYSEWLVEVLVPLVKFAESSEG